MPLTHEGKAPYAPVEPVTDLIVKFRSHGLATPFTGDVLARAGVSESLIPRVLNTLKLLDLIDDAGNPTEQLKLLAKVPTPEYKERLAEWVRAVYAPVFQFVDPAAATAEAIEDAFRGYEPSGQRGRMVTLFAGLCEYSGIVSEAPTKKRGPARTNPKVSIPKLGKSGKASTPPSAPPAQTTQPSGSFSQVVELRSGGTVTLAVTGNPLGFSSEDREFVFKLVDGITAYREKRMLSAGVTASADGGPNGGTP